MLSIRHNGHVSELTFALSAEEVELLREFIHAQERAAAASAAKKKPIYMELAADPVLGTVCRWKPEIPDEEREALLHRLRPIVLQEEPFSFVKTTALIGRHLHDGAVRHVLREERRRFEARKWQEELRISSADTVLNSDEMFRMWVNGLEYHRDLAKRKLLRELSNRAMPGLVEWTRIKMLFEKLQAIENISLLAQVLVGSRREVVFNGYTLENTGVSAA